MIIPLWIALLLYAVGLLFLGVFGLLQSSALFRFGHTFSAVLATLIFWIAAGLIVVATASMLGGVDWGQPLLDVSSFFSPQL